MSVPVRSGTEPGPHPTFWWMAYGVQLLSAAECLCVPSTLEVKKVLYSL